MINKDVKDVFNLITYTDQNPILFLKGSSKNKKILYPNDYDLFEEIETNKPKEHIINLFYNIVKKITTDIIKKENVYLIEFKFGVDDEYYLTDNQILNKKYRNEFYKNKLSKTEINKINQITDKDELLKYCQNLYKLRWSTNDILKKFILNKGKKVYFEDAFNAKSMIKIDIIAFINKKFTEFSNIFEISKLTEKEKHTNQEYKTKMLDDIKKYKNENNYFKALKRFYNLHKQNNKIIDFFNSKTGKIYHYYSNLETIKILLENYKDSSTIEKVKENINFLLDENKEVKEDVFLYLDAINELRTSKAIIKIINYVNKKLLNIINYETKQFLKINKINL
jgi:hypothetical protein